MGDVGPTDRRQGASVRQMSVPDAVPTSERAVGQPRRTRDRPLQAARHDDALHLGGVFRHVLQERAPQESTQDAQVVEQDGCGDHDQPARTNSPHRLHGAACGGSEDPGAAGCAKNQQPHGLFPCEVVHTEETAHAAVS
jgi:hypothetical protein